MSFKDIRFPDAYTYSSDSEHIPLEFYNAVFPLSKKVDLFLGYFNTGAFRVLSESFAEFIYNGGSMRMITNHYYTKLDFENLIAEPELNDYGEVSRLIKDLSKLKEALDEYGQHFFDCLKYLIKEDRLQIQPVSFGKQNLSHSKQMLFYDGQDYILTQGSMNFTLAGIVKNSESFQVEVPWNSKVSQVRIQEQRQHFDNVFNKKHSDYTYLKIDDIQKAIDEIGEKKSIRDLLETSKNLGSENYSKRLKEIQQAKKEKFEAVIGKIDNEPKFPFTSGPREYQKQAYLNWVENDYKGIFAMATGTGKTLTSLNVLLNEHKKKGYYNAIILVPTQILVNQWEDECEKFNFKNIFSTYDIDWTYKLKNILLEKRLGINLNYIFISTYASYNGNKFQNILKDFECKDTILIADEVHNLGTKRSISNYLKGIYNRIGLSATPNRNFDEDGTYEIEKYFNSFSPNHTFSYPMLKAIENGFLTPYYYYPKFVKLNEPEMKAYADCSEKLLKFFDFDKGVYREEASNLLIKRKRIIHQASKKKKELIKILDSIKNDNFKHTIVYVPEGFEPDHSVNETSATEDDDIRIIDDYNKTIKSMNIKTHQIIGGMKMAERDKVLDQFNNGLIKVLTAMKTLDEGVDIPATKCAIFCASTGNPRQFIQRRGRILRNFEDKEFAIVYDLIVEPNDTSYWNYYPRDKREKLKKMEINIFRNELKRVANFLYASKNLSDLHLKKNKDIEKLINLTEYYHLDLFEHINKLIEQDKD